MKIRSPFGNVVVSLLALLPMRTTAEATTDCVTGDYTAINAFCDSLLDGPVEDHCCTDTEFFIGGCIGSTQELTVCKGSCNGLAACADVGEGTIIEKGSCNGISSCAEVGDGTIIGEESCNEEASCELVGAGSDIRKGSCNGYSSCSMIGEGSIIKEGSCNDGGLNCISFGGLSPANVKVIGKNSCNANAACIGVGKFAQESVRIGSNACNGNTRACNRVGSTSVFASETEQQAITTVNIVSGACNNGELAECEACGENEAGAVVVTRNSDCVVAGSP